MNGNDFLPWLQGRRSIRAFLPRAVQRDVLERLLSAATSAPSATNRQPWRFAVVTGPARERLADAVEKRAEDVRAIVARSHHAEAIGSYTDFFHEPLRRAPVVIVPQYRQVPDLLAQLITSGGGDPAAHTTPAAMQPELCAVAAAVMNLMLQAHAEGLGACWMAGPTVARAEVEALAGVRAPWRMLGAVAVGYPAETPSGPSRKPLADVVSWIEHIEEKRP